MKFKVASFTYTIVAAPEGSVVGPSGNRLDCRRFPSEMEIRFDESLTLERRLDSIMRMCSDAWREHFGAAGTEEERDRRVSAFTLDFWRQIERQGGIQGIAAMNSSGVSETPEDAVSYTPSYAIRCPDCKEPVAAGSAMHRLAQFSDAYGRLACDAWCDCFHCNLRMLWVEACNTFGKPIGRVLHGPIIQRGAVSSPPGTLAYVAAD